MGFGSLAGRLTRAARSRAHWLAGPLEPMRASAETFSSCFWLPGLLSSTPPILHDVLVIPGMSGGPAWCAPLRSFLTAQGHRVHQPAAAALKGTHGAVASRLEQQVARLAASGPIAVIGWSAGGVFARQLALAAPDRISRIITLGAPIRGWWYADRPGTADQPMPVPTTAIFSRTDPLFSHHVCRQVPAPQCEDIEIVSSHLGMATHPVTLHAITDRLALPNGGWHPYRPPLPGLAHTSHQNALP